MLMSKRLALFVLEFLDLLDYSTKSICPTPASTVDCIVDAVVLL